MLEEWLEFTPVERHKEVCMNKATLVTFSIVAFGLATAASMTIKLSINGHRASSPAIVVNGKTYVPLEALQKAGVKSNLSAGTLSLTLPGGPSSSTGAAASTAAGGSNQLAALEGCVGETLFNGVWRFKVTKFEQGDVDGKPGWIASIEMRNGTDKPQFVYGTGFSNTNDSYSLAASDGNTGVWRTNYILNDFADRNVPQAGSFTYQFKFWPETSATADQTAQAPTKFIVRIDAKRSGAKYSVPDPSFRIKLDCQK